jgi:hypothetical protein
MYTSAIYNIDEISKTELNSFLVQQPYALLYTSWSYLKMLQAFLNCEMNIITVRKNNELEGIMAVAVKKDVQFGAVCNSLPFYGSNGGMVVLEMSDKNKIRNLILEEFNKLVSQNKCVASTIISNPLDPEGNSWLKQNVIHNLTDERIGQITHFPDGNNPDLENILMNSFEDPRPRNIRKAQKEGIKVYVSNTSEAIEFLYQTHYENISAINGIPKEKRFFENIPSHFTYDEYSIYIAEHEGKKIAALLLFYFNNTVEYFTPAVVEPYRTMQPTALIIYKAMLDSIKSGYSNWNWGGTWLSQGGVYDFKKRWCTTDHPYFYYTNIIDDKVYSISKETLLRNYQYFFVLPFSALINEKK